MVKVSTRQELRTELQRWLKTRSNAIKRFSDQLFADFALTESSQYDWPGLAAKAENSWEFVHFRGFVKGQTTPLRDVVCLDEPDTYLLVAADKGTATFGDIANELLIANGFCLAGRVLLLVVAWVTTTKLWVLPQRAPGDRFSSIFATRA